MLRLNCIIKGYINYTMNIIVLYFYTFNLQVLILIILIDCYLLHENISFKENSRG